MLVMPVTDINFQAYAENIAGDFFSKGVPLSDGVVKVAREHDFTPEEVRRLVEKTNTTASIHLLKTAADRKATFTLANLELVLQRTHPAQIQDMEKVAAYAGIPFTRKKDNFSKAASDQNTTQITETTIYYNRALATLDRELENRRLEKVALSNSTQKKINDLAREFITHNGQDFQKYASDCRELFGVRAVPVLDAIADYLRIPLEKKGQIAGNYIIDDTVPNIQTMAEICSGLTKLVKLGSEIEYLDKIRAGIIAGAKKVALK